jgi:hypothetical protein
MTFSDPAGATSSFFSGGIRHPLRFRAEPGHASQEKQTPRRTGAVAFVQLLWIKRSGSIAVAATTVATAATTTAVAAAAVAAATTAVTAATTAGAIFTGLGFVDRQGPAIHVLAVHFLDRLRGVRGRRHFDE